MVLVISGSLAGIRVVPRSRPERGTVDYNRRLWICVGMAKDRKHTLSYWVRGTATDVWGCVTQVMVVEQVEMSVNMTSPDYSSCRIHDYAILKMLIDNFEAMCLDPSRDKEWRSLVQYALTYAFAWHTTPQGGEWWLQRVTRNDWMPENRLILIKIFLFGHLGVTYKNTWILNRATTLLEIERMRRLKR